MGCGCKKGITSNSKTISNARGIRANAIPRATVPPNQLRSASGMDSERRRVEKIRRDQIRRSKPNGF
jgi:hypothetical protein